MNQYRVTSDELDEIVLADTAHAAVVRALDRMQEKRKRFRLSGVISVFAIKSQQPQEFVTTELLRKIGRMEAGQ